MKRTLLLLTLLLAINAFAQFPGAHADLLMGKELKVIELSESSQGYGYSDFYVKDRMSYKDVYAKSGTRTPYEKLVGKIFKVLAVEKYKDISNRNKIRLKIENKETGILFFDYDTVYDHNFVFEVIGGLQLPEGFYCENFTVKTDKFSNEVTTTSPSSDGISFIKVEKGEYKSIYLNINEIGSTLNVGKKGLILLLENGKRIEKPNAEIDVVPREGRNGYIYSAFINLEEADIKLLTENKITDGRLYIYDSTVEGGEAIKEYLKCMIK